jgi:hypothetical protein
VLNAIQMHELMPSRATADKRLSHNLMDVLAFLVWVRVTIFLDSSSAYGLYVVVNVSTNPTCESSGHACTNELKPVVFWAQRSRGNGQTS